MCYYVLTWMVMLIHKRVLIDGVLFLGLKWKQGDRLWAWRKPRRGDLSSPHRMNCMMKSIMRSSRRRRSTASVPNRLTSSFKFEWIVLCCCCCFQTHHQFEFKKLLLWNSLKFEWIALSLGFKPNTICGEKKKRWLALKRNSIL